MAITVDKWSSGNQTGSLNFNPNTIFGTLTVGDVLFLQVETANQAVSLSTPGGFIEIGQQGTGTAGGTASTRMALYYQQVTSLPISTNCVVADAGDHVTIGVMVVHGCVNDGGQPFIDPVWKVNSTASTTASWDAADNPNNNSAVLLFGVDGVDSATETMQTVTNSVVGAITTSNSASPSSTGYSWAHSTSGNGGQIVAAFSQLPTSPGSTGTSTAPHTSFVSVTATVVLLSERIVNVSGSDVGSGADSASLSASTAPSDTGSGSDPKPAVAVQVSESAAESESATVTARSNDGAAGADSAGVLYTASVSDTATGTDSAFSSSSMGITEGAAVAESAVVIVRSSEATSGGDTVVPMDVDLSSGDVGAASDSGSVLFTSSDSAQGSDSYSTVRPRPADGVSGADSAQLLVNQLAVDTATGTDSASVIAYATADVASGSESAFIFIEGVGVIGARVVRIPDEARVMLCARAVRGGIKLIPGETRIRLLGKESRTVKVVPQPRTRTVPRTEV